MDPLVPNQVRYRTAPHSEDPNHNGSPRPGQGLAELFMSFPAYRLPSAQVMRPYATKNLSNSVNETLTFRSETSGLRVSPLLVGVLLSFLLHGAWLFVGRQELAPRQMAEPAAPPLVLRLRPPPEPEPEPPKAEPAPSTPSAARAPRAQAAKPKRRAAPDVIALPRQAEAAPAADSFTVEPPEPSAPKFDADAARKMARQLANAPDPARADMAVNQLPKKELETQTKAARAIAKAKRRDCKDGVPGGLLAPLILLLDKKDSGCKW